MLLTLCTPCVFIRRPPYYLGLLVYFPPILTSLPHIIRLSRNLTCLTLGTDCLYLRTRVLVQSQCQFPPFILRFYYVIQSCFHLGLVKFKDTRHVVHFAHPSLLLQDQPSSLKFALHVLLISSAHFLDFLLRVSQIGFHKEFPNSNEFCNHLPSLPTRSLFIKSTLNPSIFCYFPFHLYLGQSAS